MTYVDIEKEIKNMKNNKMINQLAHEAINNEVAFTELYTTVESQFKSIVDSYLIRNNLTGFNFATADYVSAIGQAMWECLVGYDITKGDFMPRLVLFSRNRMKGITDYNLASKRFDKGKQVISYDELFENEEFDLEDTEAVISDTQKLVNEFIKSDKEGKVIEILTATSDSKLRNTAFGKLFGQYGATERKKVQRVRARLQAHLTSNGVFI